MNIIEMAKQAGLDWASGWTLEDDEPNRFEAFAELVAAQEREACAKIAEIAEPYKCADLIRARGTT